MAGELIDLVRERFFTQGAGRFSRRGESVATPRSTSFVETVCGRWLEGSEWIESHLRTLADGPRGPAERVDDFIETAPRASADSPRPSRAPRHRADEVDARDMHPRPDVRGDSGAVCGTARAPRSWRGFDARSAGLPSRASYDDGSLPLLQRPISAGEAPPADRNSARDEGSDGSFSGQSPREIDTVRAPWELLPSSSPDDDRLPPGTAGDDDRRREDEWEARGF